MTNLAIDYAWQHPAPPNIAAAGYGAVFRYLSHDASKNLTTTEAQALHDAGLSIGLVWESTANRAGEGVAAGAQDVIAAEAQAKALGYPKTAVIFYAVDYDATPSQVAAYFRAVTAQAHYPVGVYGSARIVEGGLAPYRWQTCAWSGGTVSPLAHVYQRQKATCTIKAAPSGWDEDVILKAVPLWTPANPTPAPTQIPVPVVTRVTHAREYIAQAIALCSASHRPRALAAAVVLRRVLNILPKE